jgi:hypothetical protein
MRGLKTDLGTRVVTAGQAFVQNIRRRHYEIAVDQPIELRVPPPSTSSRWPSDGAAGTHPRSVERTCFPITQQRLPNAGCGF